MRHIALFALFAVISCARAGCCVGAPSDAVVKPRVNGAAFPGFDKRDFPGLSQMGIWWARSPYEWVGYYLPAPCYSGAAWTGNRQALVDQGWGLAVLYVGLQAPTFGVASASRAAGAPVTRCSTNSLSAEQGRVDADDAVGLVTADGFPKGTTIFLNIERTDPLPAELDSYIRAWVKRVLEQKFTPGIYAHRLNADALFNSVAAVYRAAGDTRQPPFWVSNSQGFDLAKSPAESGYPFATMWQNPTDANETHGGVTFRIDNNVSAKRSPSLP
jgi:hypothetical protein